MIDQLTKVTDTITSTVTDAIEKLPKIDVSDIKLPEFDCSNVKLPTSEDVDKVADLYRNIAYAGLGAWVVAIQKVDEGVRSITDRTPITTDAAK